MKKWETFVRRVTPYTPGEQPSGQNIVKLNTNENPYPPAPEVTEACLAAGTELLRRYPDPTARELTAAIAERYGKKEEEVFVGVGSDDVLAMCFLTFFSDREDASLPLLFPDITYSFYDVWAELYRIPYVQVPLDQEYRICPDDYDRPARGVIFPNPNAPTGRPMPADDVIRILKQDPERIVIVDEAYVDFGCESVADLTDEYENLLVVQTFSKSRSMAGIRIGYAFGQPQLIRYLSDVKYSFNSYTMNRPAIELGAAAVRADAYYKEITKKIIATRERTEKELAALGFITWPSSANFLFVSHRKVHAAVIFSALRERGIYVRHFSKPASIDNALRITIGTEEEMDRLFAALREILAET